MNLINKEFYTLKKKFITYGDRTLTFMEFFREVNSVIIKFDSFNELDEISIINEKNPINFYILLFAMWSCDKKVVFPNRDFFEGNNFTFIKYIVNMNCINKNKNFKFIKINDSHDTIIFSSGSTGSPKGIVHSKSTFFKNAQSVKNKLHIEEITSITPLQPFLVSALNHLIVHMLSKSHLIFIAINDLSSIRQISLKYEQLSYVGSPMHIVSMLPFIENKQPELFFSSGDIFYPLVIRDIFKSFPKTIFFNVYGMAELGGRLFINKLNSKSSDKEYKCIGKNIGLTHVKYIENEVCIQSELLFKGYIKNNNYHKRKEKYFYSGDKIVNKNGIYEFYGRGDDEIKIAGNKVSMKYIEQKISTVLQNKITPIVVHEQHAFLGNILVLVLYIMDDIEISRKNIIYILQEVLDSYELPHKIYITKTLPYTQTMKIDRKKIVNNIGNMELLK